MQITTTLLNGETTVVDVPDARNLGPPVRTSVLLAGGVEVEVNAGTPEAADFFVSSTGSALAQSLTLRTGQTLRTGALGGGTGLVFVVEVGTDAVFGPAPPALGLEALATLLSAAALSSGPDGPSFAPTGSVSWSPYRTHDVVLPVEVGSSQHYVLDVRRAFDLGPTGERVKGVPVTGGLLTRSDPDDNLHVILEAPGHVAYGIPLPETDLDVLVESMSAVRVSLR